MAPVYDFDPPPPPENDQVACGLRPHRQAQCHEPSQQPPEGQFIPSGDKNVRRETHSKAKSFAISGLANPRHRGVRNSEIPCAVSNSPEGIFKKESPHRNGQVRAHSSGSPSHVDKILGSLSRTDGGLLIGNNASISSCNLVMRMGPQGLIIANLLGTRQVFRPTNCKVSR